MDLLTIALFILPFLLTACGTNNSGEAKPQIGNFVAVSLQGQSYLFENKALDYDKGEPCYLYQIRFLYIGNENKCVETKVTRDWQSFDDTNARITWFLNTMDGLPTKTFDQVVSERWLTDEKGKLYCSFYEGSIQNGKMNSYGLYYFLTRLPATTTRDLQIAEPAFIGAAPDKVSCEVLLKP